MLEIIFTVIYIFTLVFLSIYGLNALLMSSLYLVKRRKNLPVPLEPKDWPTVTIQLPIFNEKYVLSRLIDAVCKLDYPQNRLSIQILDDSTDRTTCLAASRVRFYRSRGYDITLLHRKDRSGFKAGALQAALLQAKGELVAVFDADFVPPADFLRRMVPYMAADTHLGMVQARWSHLNADYNLLTRCQALLLDGYFVIEQTARSRSGLLFNFNGSGGIWRKACIVDSGGWESDTLAEDLDLSYRAQLKGWHISYLPNIVIPAELPPQIAAFKKQQYRWTRGGVQVLRKYFSRLQTNKRLSLKQRVMAYIHLSGNLSYLLVLIGLILSLPVVLDKGRWLPHLPYLAIAGLGGPLLFGLSQASTYHDWLRRMVNLPLLLALRIGLTFSNTRAVIAAFRHNPGVFERTPKYRVETQQDSWQRNKYRVKLDLDIIAEFLLGIYAAITLGFAIVNFPPLIPAMAMFTVSFVFTGITGLLQSAARPKNVSTRIEKGEYIEACLIQEPLISVPYKLTIY